MTVKLVLLKTGETIISSISEMVVGDTGNQRVIGYFLENPCAIVVESLGDEDEIDLSSNKTKMSIRLINWIPLAKERKMPIVSDWVVSLMDPVDDLKETYMQTITSNEKSNETN
jgi:hypothetical protein